jgi:Fe-S oxidoreductase
MAKMKAEFLYGRQQRLGLSVADRILGRPEKALQMASKWPGLAGKLTQNRLFRAWLQRAYGIHPLRSLPVPSGRPFYRGQRGSGAEVLILPDSWMNYLEPEIGRDLVRVLEAVGFRVGVLPPLPSIRARISVGLLDEAKALLKEWVELLWGQVQGGATVIGAEPSEVLTFRDEALDLLEDDDLEKGASISSKVLLLEEFMFENMERIRGRFDGRGQVLAVHGHCHVKALADVKKLLQILLQSGYRPNLIEAGCCGMAGKFGYETRTYEVSMQIGELQLFPAARALPESSGICAHGFSCREQIKAGTGREARHPAQWLAAALER